MLIVNRKGNVISDVFYPFFHALSIPKPLLSWMKVEFQLCLLIAEEILEGSLHTLVK